MSAHSQNHSESAHCHDDSNGRPDLLLWGSLGGLLLLYALNMAAGSSLPGWAAAPAAAVAELVHTVWWGIMLGMLTVALLGKIPRDYVLATLGTGRGISGIARATAAGVLLDLCSHGILMVGSQLYRRGASAGQTVAFLVASPWNSLSLTLVLISLIGLYWTLAFIVLSVLVAVVTGVVFDALVARGRLPENPNSRDLPEDFNIVERARADLADARFGADFWRSLGKAALTDSRPVLRWIFFGLLLAAVVKSLVDTATLETWFGPTLAGLGLTMVAATIIEVCSEGSAPLAADIMNRGGAPGNGFAFLMTGVATDYTEIMILKDAAKSWAFALTLPLVTVPQVLALGWLLNQFA